MENNKGGNSQDLFLWVCGVLGLIYWLYTIVRKFVLLRLLTLAGRMEISVITATLIVCVAVLISRLIRSKWQKEKEDESVTAENGDSIFVGIDTDGKAVHLKPKQRGMHAQVIGTTNAGKTESVILPWAIQDIRQGRGLILIDGKADRGLLDKLWAYTKLAGREKDFRLFSLSHIEESHQFNPLVGGSPEEITERVFNAFEFENPHYRSLQFEVFSQVMRILEGSKNIPTFRRIHQAISDPNLLVTLTLKNEDPSLRIWAEFFRDLPNNERVQRTSGLTAALSHFAFGNAACLFNSENPHIKLDDALDQNLIVYFQLPVLLSPFLGKASGKMILQSFQSAVANRHRSKDSEQKFFSIFLDDFSEYLYPGFVSILNKSRSANVGVVFAHQALGDIKTMGDAIANSILTNANIKIFMRGNDPDSAEYFSKVIGTVKTIKKTERVKRGLWTETDTGDLSAREVDEFIVHPNRFKRELGVGEGMVLIPHEGGTKSLHMKFSRFEDLKATPLTALPKELAGPLHLVEEPQKSRSVA